MKKIQPLMIVLISLLFVASLSVYAEAVSAFFNYAGENGMLLYFFIITVIFLLNFVIFNLSITSSIPSFVVAIFFGIAGSAFLKPIVENETILGAFVTFSAVLILFGGGLEIHFNNFKKLLGKILSLSFIGLFLTAFLFSIFVFFLGKIFGGLGVVTAVLLGAILASTDPAAIIPVLKNLRFKNSSIKDIVISESAVTDVTGTLLTVVFLGILASGKTFNSVFGSYFGFFSVGTGEALFKEIIFGIIFGALGFVLLHFLKAVKKRQDKEHEADAAFFLFVPIFTFIMAAAFGGSGYLAAFTAGLLFSLTEKLQHTENFFNHSIEGFLKPAIFLLLGAMVDIKSLITYAPIGILAALAFMFIIRPIAVFLSLLPFNLSEKEKMSWREMLFISFVRETGAIPAVLLVTVASSGITGAEGLIPVGMWVILATLIIEPPLTPYVAKYLGVGELIKDEDKISIKHDKPVVVLASRGYSFVKRMERVFNLAMARGVNKIILLHCPEDKYTDELEINAKKKAEIFFEELKNKFNRNDFQLEFVGRKGFLQENIESLADHYNNISCVFVGKKMLDYRLAEVKNLNIPFYFID